MNKDSKQIIDNWLSRIDSQEIVVVIGAGFTRNALLESLNTSAASKIPLWNDLILSIQEKMNLFSFDSLLSFDIYREFYGRHNYEKLLLDSMPNDDLKPGEAHKCLAKMPKVKAVITTNNIDTILDVTFKKPNKIIKDTDTAESNENGIDIIYLHGHRAFPESWIFSRTDYDDIATKYPLKSSLCRSLLATYPSLFLGFGYSDHDLHSIMRYVNRTVGDYRPAMLSLAISTQNTFLADYWNRLGLTIAVIHNENDKNSVTKSLVYALKYINQKRIDKLIADGKLSPGYRNEKSFMDVLKEQKFQCRKRGSDVIFCDYHESRKNAEIDRIPENSGIISISPYTAYIKPDSETEKLLMKMYDGYIPAGSWGLMPTHRNWIKRGIGSYKTKSNTIRLLIAGIAGLPHFIDTMSLLLKYIDKNKQIEITIVDICAGPLFSIENFLNGKETTSFISKSNLYSQVFDEIQKFNAKISLVNCDIFDQSSLAKASFDIVLSHHLVTVCNNDNIVVVEKYAETIFYLLKTKGILISAQNIMADELKILAFQKNMEHKGLIPTDAKSVFDIYDYNSSVAKQGDGVFVLKETLLTIHRKER